jgi:transcriptional antiterminator NusG
VRNTQYVTGLVGSSGQRTKPTPVSELEIRRINSQIAKSQVEFDKGIIKAPFKEGDFVTVTAGPTEGQNGQVIEINNEKQVAVVELILFERKTPTEIAITDLKISK